MVALAYPSPGRPFHARPSWGAVAFPSTVGPYPRPVVGRPELGSPPRPIPYGRRRAVAGVMLAAVVAAGWVGTRAVLVGLDGGPPATVGTPAAGPPVAHVHIVQPGETLWSIVRDSGRTGDPRPVVDRLEARLGGQRAPGRPTHRSALTSRRAADGRGGRYGRHRALPVLLEGG